MYVCLSLWVRGCIAIWHVPSQTSVCVLCAQPVSSTMLHSVVCVHDSYLVVGGDACLPLDAMTLHWTKNPFFCGLPCSMQHMWCLGWYVHLHECHSHAGLVVLGVCVSMCTPSPAPQNSTPPKMIFITKQNQVNYRWCKYLQNITPNLRLSHMCPCQMGAHLCTHFPENMLWPKLLAPLIS